MQNLIINNWHLLTNLESLTGEWITGEELGKHLGYAEPRKSINNLYNKYSAKFIDRVDTGVIELRTPSGTQETRVYSERGVLKLIRYSNTELADSVMEEVFDVYLQVKHGEDKKVIANHQAVGLLEDRVRMANILKLPEHLGMIEAVKEVKKLTGIDCRPLLLQSTVMTNIPQEEEYLEPTELGKLFDKTAKEMNLLLEELGMQVRISGVWNPTKLGKKYSVRHAWSIGTKSGYNYKWQVAEIRTRVRESNQEET